MSNLGAENEANGGSERSDIEEKDEAIDFGFNCTSPEVSCWPNCKILLCHRRQARAGKKMARATMSRMGSGLPIRIIEILN